MEERKPDFKKRKEAREAVFGRESDVPRENADGIPTLSVDGTMGTRKTFTEIREKAVVERSGESGSMVPVAVFRGSCDQVLAASSRWEFPRDVHFTGDSQRGLAGVRRVYRHRARRGS